MVPNMCSASPSTTLRKKPQHRQQGIEAGTGQRAGNEGQYAGRCKPQHEMGDADHDLLDAGPEPHLYLLHIIGQSSQEKAVDQAEQDESQQVAGCGCREQVGRDQAGEQVQYVSERFVLHLVQRGGGFRRQGHLRTQRGAVHESGLDQVDAGDADSDRAEAAADVVSQRVAAHAADFVTEAAHANDDGTHHKRNHQQLEGIHE